MVSSRRLWRSSATVFNSSSRPISGVAETGRLFGCASADLIAGKSCGSPSTSSCHSRSGDGRSFSRWDPRSDSDIPSAGSVPTSACVVAGQDDLAAVAAAAMRDARWTSIPRSCRRPSRPSPVWIPIRTLTSDPDGHGCAASASLGVSGGAHGLERAREDGEERIAFSADHCPIVGTDRRCAGSSSGPRESAGSDRRARSEGASNPRCPRRGTSRSRLATVLRLRLSRVTVSHGAPSIRGPVTSGRVDSYDRPMSSLLLRLVSIADVPTADDDERLRRRVGVVAGYLTIFAPLPLPFQGQGSLAQLGIAGWNDRVHYRQSGRSRPYTQLRPLRHRLCLSPA